LYNEHTLDALSDPGGQEVFVHKKVTAAAVELRRSVMLF